MRLGGYDYSRNGAYFITICTKDRQYLFWENYDTYCVGTAFGGPQDTIILTEYGRIVRNELLKIPSIYHNVIFIPKFVIMPNHIHLILVLNASPVYGPPKAVPTIGRIVNKFKGSVSKQAGFKVWQKDFYDRIIRNEHEYRAALQYIEENPRNWEQDELFTSE